MMMMMLARKQHQSCVVCWLLEMRVVVGDRSSSQKGERTWLTQIVLQVTHSTQFCSSVSRSVISSPPARLPGPLGTVVRTDY